MLKIVSVEIDKLPNKDPSRLFFSGFSQGCFTSAAVLLRYEGNSPLGGIICFSGLQPLTPDNILKTPARLLIQSQTPFLHYNIDGDGTVDVLQAKYTLGYLQNIVYK